eukprot:Nitzschia sp. Nitz4//scaffold1_size375055//38157//42858//NITZ4_000217-RA/size375055-snap-gene-0.236-mRNA-1//-1//CDS//3329540868//1623//frame0
MEDPSETKMESEAAAAPDSTPNTQNEAPDAPGEPTAPASPPAEVSEPEAIAQPVEANDEETTEEVAENATSSAPQQSPEKIASTDNVPPPRPSGDDGPSLGAKILMNRFQSLKDRANQNAQTLWSKGTPAISSNARVVQETAQSLWKQAPKMSGSSFRAQFQPTGPTKPVANTSTEAEATTETASTSVAPTPDATEAEPSEPVKSETDAKVEEIKPNQFSLAEEEGAQPVEESKPEHEGSKGRTAPDVSSRLRVGVAFSKAAATVAYESVLTSGFRGRYKESEEVKEQKEEELVEDSRPLPESQTDIILKSRVGQHMQEILNQLEPHEYAMLLGKGMLGVNLKQCYLKNHGVFIDFMVDGGQAQTSGVVRSGDLPVRLGDMDLRKGTIMDLPKQIANAKRPVVMVLATGTTVPLERMNYIDVAVAMMHRARDFYNKRGTLSNLPSASSPSKNGKPNSTDSTAAPIKSMSDTEIPPIDSVDNFLTPPAPTLDIRREFQKEVPLRCYDNFIVEGLCQVYDMDSNFREAVRHAFLTCALDSRRLPFLSRHFAEDEELSESHTAAGKMTPSAQLMLFLELTSFLDLYNVTPMDRRRDMAIRIALKFFLPSKVGNKLQPPQFDFHHIVPDASLRHLEVALGGKSRSIPRDLFIDFSKAVVESLTGPPFISFLVSAEASRMRAYLRSTAPFVNLPLRELIDSLVGVSVHPGATNCFAFMLLFLLCQLEKEPAGEHKFVKHEDGNRLLGAPNDLCCVIFLKRTFLPTLSRVKGKMSRLKPDAKFDPAIAGEVIQVCERLWDMHISSTIEVASKSNEVEDSYNAVRVELERVAAEVVKIGDDYAAKRESVDCVLQSKLVELSNVLADELLFNYAANVNTKFREHKIHEWLCNEMCKLRAMDPNWHNNQEIPSLPPGCIKRLLRKAELPDGVSSHKPFKEPLSTTTQSSNRNAEYAVVFGSSVNADLSSQMPVPGIETTDIRRYTCQRISLDAEADDATSIPEEFLPPTFESYAYVPPPKSRPLGDAAHQAMRSMDGWDVSLVTFTIPNAESSGADSALFGVSLFLQYSSDTPIVVEKPFTALVTDEKEEEPADSFVSPVSDVVPGDQNDSDTKVDPASTKRKIAVDMALPVFNSKLQTTSWVDMAQSGEYRNESQPSSVGLSLVSQRNVIIAMRETLVRFLYDCCSDGNGAKLVNCGALVEILGNFVNPEVEPVSLRCLLHSYLKVASSPWNDKPLMLQSEEFEKQSLGHLTNCLPPAPLSLLFIAALLEQKIILSSSRRSILHSTVTALTALLRPLKWSHLMVPLVPGSLAGDLVQYPAPFILGIPSEEAENAALIGNLPRDVSLVDLDVGRVILAPDFGFDNEMVQKSEDSAATAKALRSQVLFLAQALGNTIGNSLCPETWLCDVAIQESNDDGKSRSEKLLSITHAFIAELLEGTPSCCYWLEEAAQAYGTTSEPTVLFDEDKFFAVKNLRATQGKKLLFQNASHSGLALGLDDFDLVLESFLRCQSMSIYVSSQQKTEMAYY